MIETKGLLRVRAVDAALKAAECELHRVGKNRQRLRERFRGDVASVKAD